MLVQVYDTAGAAKMVAEKQDQGGGGTRKQACIALTLMLWDNDMSCSRRQGNLEARIRTPSA